MSRGSAGDPFPSCRQLRMISRGNVRQLWRKDELVRLGMLQTEAGPKLVGVTLEGKFVDLCEVDVKLPATLHAVLEQDGGLVAAAHALAAGMTKGPFVTGTPLAPIARPGKVVCIGLNYRDHAEESGLTIPSEPVVFNKFSQCVIGPEEPVILPAVSSKVDYEAELVMVIGKRGKRIAKQDAWGYIAGYTIGNDVSARDWQIGRPGSQWLLGKTADTFAPIGPWLVTADEVGDARDLRVQLRLNGQTMQDSTTKELIFGMDEIIAHLSQISTLEPGDVIFTGTPPGVGMARKPPVFVQPGDVMEVEIDGFGVLRNAAVAESK